MPDDVKIPPASHVHHEHEFEISMPTHPPLTGKMHAEVYEGGVQSNRVIRTDRDWSVHCYWELKGALASCICGEWCLQLRMESMGPGEELVLPGAQETRIPLDPCGDGCYEHKQTVPAGTIKTPNCGIPYKLVATLTYIGPCERPGPMAGFCELPMVMFFDPDK